MVPSFLDTASAGFTSNVKTTDFIQCTGFAFDSSGKSYGVAAGGDSDSGSADTFNFFMSSWGVGDTTTGGANSLRIGFTALNTDNNNKYANLVKDRFQSPSIATNGTHAYLAYYDLITGEIRFQGGKISTTRENNKGAITGTLADNFAGKSTVKTYDQEKVLLQIIASNDGVIDRYKIFVIHAGASPCYLVIL